MMKNIEGNLILEEKDLKKKTRMLGIIAQQSRLDVLELLYKRGNGHWGGSASSAELLTTLVFHILNIDPQDPQWPNRDRFILSKGHAAPMLYVLLARRGFFDISELQSSFRQLNSRFQGHPCMNITPGVDMSTGALGHGLSVGLGMALAAKVLKAKYKTYVIIGDGDLNEGVTWEGIMSAAKFKPPGLFIMVDYNKVQLDGPCDKIMPLDPLIDKFKAFNLKVSSKIYDGHSVAEIIESWKWMKNNSQEPVVVIYKTCKGKGISFMENDHKWHGAQVDDKSYLTGKDELMERLEKLQESISFENFN
jgi:transketolase